MPNHGPNCKDIMGKNLFIKGKKVIDENGNFKTAGKLTTTSLLTRGDATVCGTLRTDCIQPKVNSIVLVKSPLNTTQWFEVNGVKVVGSQVLTGQGNANGTAQSASDCCNSIMQILIDHGLISSPP